MPAVALRVRPARPSRGSGASRRTRPWRLAPQRHPAPRRAGTRLHHRERFCPCRAPCITHLILYLNSHPLPRGFAGDSARHHAWPPAPNPADAALGVCVPRPALHHHRRPLGPIAVPPRRLVAVSTAAWLEPSLKQPPPPALFLALGSLRDSALMSHAPAGLGLPARAEGVSRTRRGHHLGRPV